MEEPTALSGPATEPTEPIEPTEPAGDGALPLDGWALPAPRLAQDVAPSAPPVPPVPTVAPVPTVVEAAVPQGFGPVPAQAPSAPSPSEDDAPSAVRELLVRLRDRADEAPTPDAAVHLLESVAREMTGLLGRYDRDTLVAWRRLGGRRCAAGDAAGAVHLLGQVAADAAQALGPDDPDALEVRLEHARALGEAGDPYGAVHLLREVQPSLVRALGPYDARALASQARLAHAVALTGDVVPAAGMLMELIPAVQHHLGPEHPLVAEARCSLGRLVPQWRRSVGGAGPLPPVAAVAMVHRLLVWDFASDREADAHLTELERATGHRDLAGRLAAVPDEMPAEQATALLLGPA